MITLGFFILLNQQERRSVEAKIAGLALNSGPINARGKLEGEIRHWLASPLRLSQHLHSKSVGLNTRVCSVVSGQENLSVIKLSLPIIISIH